MKPVKGQLQSDAKAEIEEEGSKHRIVITEIPYGVKYSWN